MSAGLTHLWLVRHGESAGNIARDAAEASGAEMIEIAARGADPLQATVWGVHVHGLAGDVLARRRGPLGYLARELLDEIPAALARIAR